MGSAEDQKRGAACQALLSFPRADQLVRSGCLLGASVGDVLFRRVSFVTYLPPHSPGPIQIISSTFSALGIRLWLTGPVWWPRRDPMQSAQTHCQVLQSLETDGRGDLVRERADPVRSRKTCKAAAAHEASKPPSPPYTHAPRPHTHSTHSVAPS